MKRLLASLLFLLPIFTFSVSGAKAADINCDDPIHAAAFGGKEKCLTMAPILNGLFNENKTNGPWYNQTPIQFASKVFGGSPDEIFGERYTYAQINWIINSLVTILNPSQNITTAGDLINFMEVVRNALAQNIKNHDPYLSTDIFGPMAVFGNGLTFLYSIPPASGINEVKNIAAKLDLATPALAQGYGYNGLTTGGAVKRIWNASKNVSFFFMVILLILSGFLIMFRVKINPQTVISIQTMIPKLIITLVLVLFSFAIAGFLIDLVYVFIGLFTSLLLSSQLNLPGISFSQIFEHLSDSYFWTYFVSQNAGTSILAIIVMLVFTGGGAVLTIPAGGVGFAPGLIIGIILAVCILATTLIISVKVYMMLIKAYVSVLLQIAFAPLQIMMDLIPGQQGFGPWIRGLVANLSVFVVVPIMFALQDILGNILPFGKFFKDWGDLGGNELNLPMTLLTSGGALSISNLLTRGIIGFTIFAMTPKVADMVRDFLKVPAFKHGANIMEDGMAGMKVKGAIERHQKESEADKLQRAKARQEGVELELGARGVTGAWQDATGASNKEAIKNRANQVAWGIEESKKKPPTSS